VTTREDRHRTRVEQVLGAAARLFRQHGFDGTGMAAVAAESGLSVGGIYRHFATKDDIVTALVARDLTRIRDSLPPAGAAARRSARSQVQELVSALVDASIPDQDTAALVVEFMAVATRDSRVADLLRHHNATMTAELTNRLAAVPGVHPWSARPCAVLMLVLVDGLTVAVAVDGMQHRQGAGQEIAELAVGVLALD
jgi:AcrR family transcriptional regulator